MNTGDASEDKKFSEPLSRLKQERELRAWTQSEVAERIGTTQVNVSRWEKGITVPGPYYRQKLGELFSKSVDELGLIPSKAEEVDTSAPPSESAPSLSPTIWNVPYRRNPFFTGREDILNHLNAVLQNSKTAALTQAQRSVVWEELVKHRSQLNMHTATVINTRLSYGSILHLVKRSLPIL